MESLIFDRMAAYDYENLFFCQEKTLGLRAIIAIHNTTLGPAAGGIRMWPYESEVDAIEDVLRLARGMAYKCAACGASYGGGMRIVPHARPDDGMFDACVVSDLPRFEVLRLVPKIYSGGHVGHPAVEMLRCASLTAETTEQVRCQADGELVGDLPAQFKIHPAALRCVTGG